MSPTTLVDTPDAFARLADRVILFLPQVVIAVVILVAGLLFARWVAHLLGRAFAFSTRIGDTVRAPLISIVRYMIVIFTLIIALGQVGVQTTSLLAVLGAAGLAVGLALQGTLTNIAAGIMLLWLRPFRVGDYIETSAMGGTVREIGLFACHLETFDGIFIFAPNAVLWNVWMRNHTRAGPRTVAWSISLSRTVELAPARAVLEAHWPADGGSAGLSDVDTYLDSLKPDEQVLVLRGIVSEGAIAAVQRAVPAEIRRVLLGRFGTAGEPRAIQRLVPGDGDPSRFLGEARAPRANRILVNDRPEAADQGAVATPPR